MNQQKKEEMFNVAQEHVESVRKDISESTRIMGEQLERGKQDYKTLSPSDQVTQMMLIKYGKKRLDELERLYPSLYFVRCDVLLDGENEIRTIYFSKFIFSERDIYSWAAPIASIRFESVGDITYKLTNEEERRGKLLRRDQYMIVDGNIVFQASESVDAPRELVFQKHFSARKQGFMLPEIVAQMEKAQDQVIRAHHIGPFAISGPAGSGKTTLALHRVAYLVQSPDTTQLYPSESIVVFVQDAGTKVYFSQLLPELGIRDVVITTFSEWALKLLGLTGLEYTEHYGETEDERDIYEYTKLQALRSGKPVIGPRSPFTILEGLYAGHLNADLKKRFREQKQKNVLDRIDIAVLLLAEESRKGRIHISQKSYVQQRNGKWVKKIEQAPLEYSLVVIDEFQNYLPEQLMILKNCAKPTFRSTVYVGDLSQQIRFGTLRRWEDIGEIIESDRTVRLHKVYRNTKNILRYIRSLEYEVEIPAEMREGVPVEEHVMGDVDKEIEYINKIRDNNPDVSIGILAKVSCTLDPFRKAFYSDKKTHVFTIEESQGVEFDIVCLVEVNSGDWSFSGEGLSEGFVVEKQKIIRDLLYIALTRAMSELHVLGKDRLGNVISHALK